MWRPRLDKKDWTPRFDAKEEQLYDMLIDLIIHDSAILQLKLFMALRSQTDGLGMAMILLPLDVPSKSWDDIALLKADSRKGEEFGKLPLLATVNDVKSYPWLGEFALDGFIGQVHGTAMIFIIRDGETQKSMKHVKVTENENSNGPSVVNLRIQVASPFAELICKWCMGCGKHFEHVLQKCSDCHLARYCSSECQGKGWPRHKLLCCYFQVYTQPSGKWKEAVMRLLPLITKRGGKTEWRTCPHNFCLF